MDEEPKQRGRRRTVFADVTSGTCYHFAYDERKVQFEKLSDEELSRKLKLQYSTKRGRREMFLSEYLPSFWKNAALNALLDEVDWRRKNV